MALNEHFKVDGSPKRGMSQVKAFEMAEYLNSEHEEEVTPYECSYCNLWHIGH